jgi:LmbE family N-acetylglucosaminyl deacetylase
MNETIHIMAIGAHAGDVEISMGAAILAHTSKSHKATIVHLTLGAKGHLLLSEEEYSIQKKAEATLAALKLKADLRILPFLDGELVADSDSVFQVVDLIRDIKPTHILTHWPGSIHKDHHAAYQIVKDAIFYAALPSIQRANPSHEVIGPILSENWEDSLGYVPQIYLDITDVYDAWLDSVRSYELFSGTISKFDYIGYYSALASLRGTAAGFKKAVTFSSDLPLAAYLTDFEHPLKLFVSRSPIFTPALKQNTVG